MFGWRTNDFAHSCTYGRLQAMEWETQNFDNAHRFLKFLWNRGYDFGNTNEDRTVIRPPHFLGNSRHGAGADLVWEIHCLVFVAIKRVQKYRKRGICVLNWDPEVVSNFERVTDIVDYNFPCIHFQSLRRWRHVFLLTTLVAAVSAAFVWTVTFRAFSTNQKYSIFCKIYEKLWIFMEIKKWFF